MEVYRTNLRGIFKLKNTLVQCVCYVIADTICRLIQFPTISNKAADARNSVMGSTRILFDKGSETVLIALGRYLCKPLKTEALGIIQFTWYLKATNNGTLSSEYPIFFKINYKNS